MSNYDLSIHTNPDAQAWAKFFCKTHPGVLDEGIMIGWFANAMMAMHDYLGGRPINGDHAQWLIDNNVNPWAAR